MKPDKHKDPTIARRQYWMGVLARAGAPALEDALNGLDSRPAYTLLRAPETGMAMIRARADGAGRRFNLGEMTITRCSLRLEGDAPVVGHGYVAGRNRRHAELAALFDALFQADPDAELHDRIIPPLQARREEALKRQAVKTAATRVNFFTMARGQDKED
ncbi:phosphonate C-P lyase system protein PhnG [Pseudodesulfovibrio cashew]|uniref:Phosphonate C-P lyase system protein PhnG n=1 Tax=Pseudodesulfovibrio cashew TaxID=2678688 RepID=A0A6I6JFK3_9BACT|nr:phosphonate C-P lyase system protein PhnG [Pseudodesulfovibrio cashew]QGY39202.1 phosphonate C-P lyase system protein PhnG [Pseudodesulfovibrio cashew]